MATLRPVTHLENIIRAYPNAWRRFDQILVQRHLHGDWPSWCYCPMGVGATTIVEEASGYELPREQPMVTHDPRHAAAVEQLSLHAAALAALAAWRPTQGYYRFHPELLSALKDTDLSGQIPVEHLYRLPEWCVYIENEDERTHGFFAHLDYPREEAPKLRLLMDHRYEGLIPVGLSLRGTLEESFSAYAMPGRPDGMSEEEYAPDVHRMLKDVFAPAVAVLLYLCAGDKETRPTLNAKRVHSKPGLQKRKHGVGRYQPVLGTEVWETGFRLGTALERARSDYDGPPLRTMRPHIRKMHYHSFWVGSGESRRLDLRWMPPIPVNMELPNAPTVLKVDERSRK
ncbi:hypothetical protein LZC95_19565 [Pendulispora brunnea]|uniref:Uncharacterized protein n=1 Tax=Pendulispora brunnea TaxID=2905690 RepID=A0ABZ2KRQ2_9BACT